MSNQEKLRSFVGERGTSIGPVIIRLNDMGIDIRPQTVRRVRSGERSGSKTQIRLDCSEAIRRDRSDLKKGYFSQLLRIGLEYRQTQTSPYDSRFLAVDFTNGIGEELGIGSRKVRYAVKAMRADTAYTDALSAEPSVVRREFEAVVDDFYDRTSRRSSIGASVRTVVETWRSGERRTVGDFYRLLYTKGPRAIASWLMYEIPFLMQFYQNQPSTLSRMDEIILRTTARNTPRGQIVAEIRNATGVPFDRNTIDFHRNILVYGKPIAEI